MLKPLKIRDLEFDNNLVQGPLAGVSCAPFRRLTWRYSKPAFTYTEMISCKTLLHRHLDAQKRFLLKEKDEGPVCYQLSSSDPKELAEGVKIATEAGADLIDLNCGCPVKKIRSKGAGSRLLSDAGKLYELILAMKQNTHVPVSVKIRVESPKERFNADVAQAIEDAQPDFVTVHGRHWTEHYETPCRYEEIAYFVDQLSMPVIGNGDVACLDSLKRMLATGCDAAMIARAGVGQPWLIQDLKQGLLGESYERPSGPEIAEVFIEHVQGLIDLMGQEKFAILQARKFAKYYARYYENRHEFISKINECDHFDQFQRYCSDFFV